MYCIKCGVHLAASEPVCPLCGTRVFHPDLETPHGQPPYPRSAQPALAPRSFLGHVILTALFLIPILVVPLCDIQLNRDITWSGYVTGALLLSYVMLVLPLWFRKPNFVIFIPCDFAAIGGYLFYINYATGGQWFMTFAFPLVVGLGLILSAVVTLLRYVPKGALYIWGGACMLLGCFMVLIEYMVNLTFQIPKFFGWSFYPLIALMIMGGLLIFLAICKPARQTLERKFFL